MATAEISGSGERQDRGIAGPLIAVPLAVLLGEGYFGIYSVLSAF